jgi:histidine kinase
MINILDYEVKEQISTGSNLTIYRGRRIHDGKKVIIKLLNDEHPTIEKLASFRREYEIAKRLSGDKGDKIIEMVDLFNYKNSLLMVMEDFGGKSVAQELKSKDLDSFEKLLLAMNITGTMVELCPKQRLQLQFHGIELRGLDHRICFRGAGIGSRAVNGSYEL